MTEKTREDKKGAKNSAIPEHCRGTLPAATIDRHTGDALTMIALKTALDRVAALEKRMETLEARVGTARR